MNGQHGTFNYCVTIMWIEHSFTDGVLYTNIDLKLRNKSHGPMYYKIGDICVYNSHLFLYFAVITRQSNAPISQFNSPCNVFTSLRSMFVYNTGPDMYQGLQ